MRSKEEKISKSLRKVDRKWPQNDEEDEDGDVDPISCNSFNHRLIKI